MLFQEQEECGTEAALGETACAAMACRATIRKQPHCRFALIEILSLCRTADERIDCTKDEPTAPQFRLRHARR
jgi:hypothetical protein